MNMQPRGMTPEQNVVRLLGQLRDASPEYPARLQAQRRAAVLAGLAAIPVATGLLAIPWIARLVKLIKAMGFIDKVILAVEVATITGLTGYGAVTAYQYRYQLQQLLFPSGPQTPFPTLSIPPTNTPVPPTEPRGTGTPTPTGTLLPTIPPLFTQPVFGTPVPGIQSTPLPPIPPQVTNPPPQPTNQPPKPPKPTRTPPGLHLGQTKTPKPPKP